MGVAGVVGAVRTVPWVVRKVWFVAFRSCISCKLADIDTFLAFSALYYHLFAPLISLPFPSPPPLHPL